MKRRELFQLYEKLQGLKYMGGSNFFKVSLVKNMKTIEGEIQKSQLILTPSNEFLEFEKERVDTCERLGDKDENGEILKINDEYIISDQEIFDKEINILKEKHKDVLIKRDGQISDYNKGLEEIISFDLIKFGPNDLPEEMTITDIEDIYLMLK